MSEDDPAYMSKMLFEAREEIEMWADVVDKKHGWSGDPLEQRPSFQLRELVRRIDTYRRNRGWKQGGYGGEA